MTKLRSPLCAHIYDNAPQQQAHCVRWGAKRMNERLPLKSLHFGEIDASIELKFGNETYFLDAFSVPHDLNKSAFIHGSKFFILGLKGTGKTALMRYLSREFVSTNRHTKFIIFKHDVSEDERAHLERLSGITVASDQTTVLDVADFEDAWMLYCYSACRKRKVASGAKRRKPAQLYGLHEFAEASIN
jgi:Cdc6-like AAA superfamily ATPase